MERQLICGVARFLGQGPAVMKVEGLVGVVGNLTVSGLHFSSQNSNIWDYLSRHDHPSKA